MRISEDWQRVPATHRRGITQRKVMRAESWSHTHTLETFGQDPLAPATTCEAHSDRYEPSEEGSTALQGGARSEPVRDWPLRPRRQDAADAVLKNGSNLYLATPPRRDHHHRTASRPHAHPRLDLIALPSSPPQPSASQIPPPLLSLPNQPSATGFGPTDRSAPTATRPLSA